MRGEWEESAGEWAREGREKGEVTDLSKASYCKPIHTFIEHFLWCLAKRSIVREREIRGGRERERPDGQWKEEGERGEGRER